MISSEREAEILRLAKAEGIQAPGTIGRLVGVHPDVVRRILAQAGLMLARDRSALFQRPSRLDPYADFVDDILNRYPAICASRIFEMLISRGYTGVSPGHVRRFVRSRRKPEAHEAFLRLSMLPGEQAQVDWAYFGLAGDLYPGRKLSAFVVTLSSSRMIFFRFFLSMRMREFLQGFSEAFEFFGGVPRTILIDNLKSGVCERVGDVIRFNPSFVDISKHYAFEPRAAGVRRGNEKGRVERSIRYLRDSFFAARSYTSLADLNEQARAWCLGVAARRPWREDRTQTVSDAFFRERERLLPLPPTPYPCVERTSAKVGKQPYVSFDGNEYSVPHTLVRQFVSICVTEERVIITGPDAAEPVAVHVRSWGRHVVVEDASHIADLRRTKAGAQRNEGLHRLVNAVPEAKSFIEELALRGENVGGAVGALLRELDIRGGEAVSAAVGHVLMSGSCTLRAVLFMLRKQEAGPPQAEPAEIPARFAHLSVTHHDPRTYDDVTGVER